MDFIDENDEMELFNLQLEKLYKQQNKLEDIKASKLKISIMSSTASFNSILNLKALSLFLKKDDKICFIDSMFNMTRKVSNISKKKIFYNQITLKIRPYYNPNKKINLNLVINLKLFRNGNLQMCGLRSENDGYMSLKVLLKQINSILDIQRTQINLLRTLYNESIIKVIVNKLFEKNQYLINYDAYMDICKKNSDYNKYTYIGLKDNFNNKYIKNIININNNLLNIKKYNITLINSDFYIGFKINRNNVYDFILNEENIICDYDPCIYQGVLIKFYWNNSKSVQNGKCNCTIPCNGKGVGYGNGECKKITISVFQSGNIIITGKCIREEINYIYNFIVELFHKNIEKIRQLAIVEEEKK